MAIIDLQNDVISTSLAAHNGPHQQYLGSLHSQARAGEKNQPDDQSQHGNLCLNKKHDNPYNNAQFICPLKIYYCLARWWVI